MSPTLNLTTQQLEYVVAAADRATWAEAAADLGVTPSALSQGIGQLERRLGLALFERHGRRRTPVPAARPVLDYARSVVAQTRELARWADGARAADTGQLRVGMIDLAATTYFGPTLKRFVADRPGVDLHLAVAPSATLCQQLLAGRLSLAVVVTSPTNTGRFELTPLLDEDLAVYAPGGPAPSAVEDWGPWVTFPAGSHTRALVAGRLAEIGAPFEVVAESHQPEVLRGMVALGMGWTILPVIQGEAQPNPLLRASPDPIATRALVAARRHGAVEDPLASSLLTELVAAAQATSRDP